MPSISPIAPNDRVPREDAARLAAAPARRRMDIVVAVLGLVSMISSAAGAQTPERWSLRLVREPGAESCIDGAELRQRVALHMGAPEFVSPAADDEAGARPHLVRGRIAPHWGGYAVELVLVDGDGVEVGMRQLEDASDDCRELDGAIALLVAMMLEQGGVGRITGPLATGAAPSDDAAVRTGSGSAGTEVAIPFSVREPAGDAATINGRPRAGADDGTLDDHASDDHASDDRAADDLAADIGGDSVTIAVAAGAKLETALTPNPALGMAIGLDGTWAWLRFGLDVAYLPADDLARFGGTTHFDGLDLGAHLCPEIASMARLALRLCGHGRIGWLRAEGHGYDRDMTSVRRHATVGAGGLASYRLAHGVTADLAGAVLGRVERPRFYVADGEGSVLAVHRSGDVGLEVGLRLSMAFATL